MSLPSHTQSSEPASSVSGEMARHQSRLLGLIVDREF
jgi:hypothetical protein